MIKRPKKNEYPPYHGHYLNLVPPRVSAKTLLRRTFKEVKQLLQDIPEEFGDLQYEEGKWSLKDVIMHTIDAERVFSYRILYFIRGDRIGMPGFNQDFWMEEVDTSERTIKDLIKEWKIVRDNTLYLLEQCTDEKSVFEGKATGWIVTPRALFFIIIGHHIHHMHVLQEKYLPLIKTEEPEPEPEAVQDSGGEEPPGETPE